MSYHKKLLEELLISRNGLEVDSIHFVSDEIYHKDEKEKLIAIGKGTFEPIRFSIKGLQYPEGMGTKSSCNMRGANICYRNGLAIVNVILLPYEKFPQTDVNSMLQLCALLHELGHVEDMQKEINFSFLEIPTVRLVEAEVYAHIYTLNHLKRMGAIDARNIVASALYKYKDSANIFEKSLYKEISNSIGRGRIKKWVRS